MEYKETMTDCRAYEGQAASSKLSSSSAFFEPLLVLDLRALHFHREYLYEIHQHGIKWHSSQLAVAAQSYVAVSLKPNEDLTSRSTVASFRGYKSNH